MGFAYKYSGDREEAFGKQIDEMVDCIGTRYYEIWMGTDGYAVSHPETKLYDSVTKDESKLVSEFGIGLDKLRYLVTMRAGAAYALTPETYEDRTGEKFPYEAAQANGKESVVVMVLSRDDAKERIRLEKFASSNV